MSEVFASVLSVDQLAKMVHKSPASIRSDASRNPSVLPPICRLPGNKRLLWRLEDVSAWIAQHVQRDPAFSHYSVEKLPEPTAKKRGRPRKTELRGVA